MIQQKKTEMCTIKCDISKNDVVIICSIYRSPSGNIEAFVEGLSSLLQNISQLENTIIICGDININLLENSKQKQTFINLLLEYIIPPTIL